MCFLLLILAAAPTAAVCHDHRLLDPIIALWVRFQPHGASAEDTLPALSNRGLDLATTSNRPASRSAYLGPEIVPLDAGESP